MTAVDYKIPVKPNDDVFFGVLGRREPRYACQTGLDAFGRVDQGMYRADFPIIAGCDTARTH